MGDWMMEFDDRDDSQAQAELAAYREYLVMRALCACLARNVPQEHVQILCSEVGIDYKDLLAHEIAA